MDITYLPAYLFSPLLRWDKFRLPPSFLFLSDEVTRELSTFLQDIEGGGETRRGGGQKRGSVSRPFHALPPLRKVKQPTRPSQT